MGMGATYHFMMGATLRIVNIVKISSPNKVKNAKGGTYLIVGDSSRLRGCYRGE